MDTRLLRSFLAVVRTGSVTRAAAELAYVQSTVTSHIQSLERLTGARLLDRHPAGVTPTEAGKLLAGHARRLLDIEDQMLTEVGAQTPAGPVRLCAPESMCAYRLPPVLRTVAERLPEVRLTLIPAATSGAVAALADRRADLALALEPEIHYSTVDCSDLGRQRLSLVAPADTTLPAARTITPAELAAAGVVLLEEGCGFSDELAAMVLRADPTATTSRFGGVETVKRCVEAGLGLAVLPTVTVRTELAEGRLVALRAPDFGRYHLWLLHQAGRWISPPVAAVHALLESLGQRSP